MHYDVISADNHILEPRDLFVERLPRQYRDRAPRVLRGEDGGDGWFFVLQQHPGEPVFGLDVGQDLPGEERRGSPRISELIKWDDVLTPAPGAPPARVMHLSFADSQSAVAEIFKARGPRFPNWGQSSAEVAADTLRRPARVAFHARSLIRG
jgi:hypothetical protein